MLTTRRTGPPVQGHRRFSLGPVLWNFMVPLRVGASFGGHEPRLRPPRASRSSRAFAAAAGNALFARRRVRWRCQLALLCWCWMEDSSLLQRSFYVPFSAQGQLRLLGAAHLTALLQLCFSLARRGAWRLLPRLFPTEDNGFLVLSRTVGMAEISL